MKPTAIFVLLFCQVATAQTNFFPFLCCSNRTYTNATIETVTPATVTVFWDGGGERVPITNLPLELQIRYHYNPQDAQKYLDLQAAKKASQKERDNREADAAKLRAQAVQIQRARIAANNEQVLATDTLATNQLVKNGFIELTAKFIKNYPEKVTFKNGWMDVTFCDVHPPDYLDHDFEVWFTVEDKNHEFFDKCIASKENFTNGFDGMVFTHVKQDDFVMKLNRGDRIRLIGKFYAQDLFFVDKILMIK
jgi:hypothetical protein